MRLKDKVAIVTGSTSGIGQAAAKKLASEEAKVVVVGRREEKGQQVVSDIQENKGEALVVKGTHLCVSSF